MATSPVEICNLALGWLGSDLIISLDDSSVEAKLCKANYAIARDAVIEDREWTFAVQRIEPSRLTEQPVYGYDYQFQIPPEVIRILQVSGGTSTGTVEGSFKSATRGGTGTGRETRIEWAREGDKIMTIAADRIFIRALVQVEDTTKFSPAFDQALAARLAMDMCVPLTNSVKNQSAMAELYAAKLKMAAASDGMQGRSMNVRADAFTIVR